MRHCPNCGREVSPAATRCPACGQPLEGARTGGSKGGKFALFAVVAAVGCGFLVVFGGIVAAILIPNFIDALHKAKQKRTMADLRDLGTAIETYRADHEGVPAAGSIEELAAELEPEYIPSVPRSDAWQHPVVYVCWAERPVEPTDGACDTYRLMSAGRDGAFEHDDPAAYPVETFTPSDYDRDIVFGDGLFLRYPGVPDPGEG